MVATLVFCGLELLFALNAWLAGASETQGAFAYLALGKLEPLPYPPSLVIQRNLMWLALAFLVGPAVLFRRFVRPALAAATLLLVGSVILDMALGAPTLKPEPSVGFPGTCSPEAWQASEACWPFSPTRENPIGF